MKWINAGKKNVTFHMIEMPDGAFAVGIIGLTPSDAEWQKSVSDCRFRISASGRILLRAGSIKFNEVKSIFPFATIKDAPEEAVYVLRKKVSDRSIVPDTQASIFIGKNYLGQDVHSTSTGSRYINGRDGQPMSEETASVAPAFLRTINDGDIDLCADGFVIRMETENMRVDDIRRFCSTIYGESSIVGPTDNRLRDVQEAIEAAIFRKTSKILHENGDIKTGFALAAKLSEHQPPMAYRTSTSVELQQYSTPVTLSIAVQYALGDVSGLSVLEPTIGNASLISALSNAKITGVELDKNRYIRTKKAIKESSSIDSSNTTLIHGDFLETEFGEKFDAVIANPPFGGLAKPVTMNGLRVTRLDHQIIMKSLEHRNDNGRSVFIIGADRDAMFPGNEGKISGGSEKLFAWLSDHYEINAFEVSGDLYKKQGANYPVRVIAIGGKRTDEEAREARENKTYRISTLPVVSTLDELWGQASATHTFLSKWSLPENSLTNNIEENEEEQDAEKNPSFGNDFQSQYEPMSAGSTIAMIPKNLVVPQQTAFNRFLKDHSDPIAYVKKELKMEDLSEFEPEQIDAIALGIWNMKRGRALILADQTGMGKGRVVAAISRWAAMNNKQCNFLTEKASLFSDLYRDIRDIGSEELFTPFILNADEQIVSLDGEDQTVIVPKTTNAVRTRIVESGIPPIEDGYNLMLATYSQFNRPESKSSKSAFIKDASKGGVIIMDESHNAAGDSNTGRNITDAVMGSGSALYSSATFAKGAKNMGVYYKAFPTSVDMTSLTDTLVIGGEPLQEVLSAMLCEDGVLVRREHDLSQLKFPKIDVPHEMYERNVLISDKVSDILAAMSYFSGDVEQVAKNLDKEMQERLKSLSAEQREGKRLGVSYTNFGSRLYSISRQVALILSADQVVSNSLRALKEGQKPVIVLEQTMESIMNEVLDSMSLEERMEMQQEGLSMKPLMVSDLLNRLLEKMTYINRTDDYGKKEKVLIFDADKTKEGRKNAQDTIDAIKKMIADLPEITAMPLDYITNKIKEAGYVCGEVSGRSTTYIMREDGMVQPEVNTREKNNEIFKFNSGAYDAIILTRSGCTGVSLHSSEKFADRRQRVLIEAQIAANVNERVQFFGRINRRGQVSVPEIWSITSGLPWENRSLAMQNMKLRKLSANTQSNRNSSAEMKDVIDIINPVGNEVCKSFLFNNPEIMARLSIDPDKENDETNEDGCFFANKLTGRLCLLHVADQERIYKEIGNDYDAKIVDLNNKGINPLESRIVDIKATVIDRKIIAPGREDSDSIFDSPVFAEKLEWKEHITPIRSAEAIQMANDSIDKMIEGKLIKLDLRRGYQLPWSLRERERFAKTLKMVDASEYIQVARAGFLNAMERALPERFINPDDPAAAIAAALADKDVNSVKRLHYRMNWLTSHAEHLMPGCPIRFTSEDGPVIGVIVGVTPPPEKKEHYLGSWDIKVLRIGAQKPILMTYNTLIEDSAFESLEGAYSSIYNQMDNAPGGALTFSRWVLSGNLFRASELAAKSGIGRAGIYTDNTGMRHRAIICRSTVNLDDIFSMEIPLSEVDAKEEIPNLFASKSEGSIDFGNEFELRWSKNGDKLRLITPGSKTKGGSVFLNENIIKITGEFSGSRQVMSAEFSRPKNMDAFISAIYHCGLTLKKLVENNQSILDLPQTGNDLTKKNI